MKKYIKVFKRWFGMLSGKSVFHKAQSKGTLMCKDAVRGYYSDLRHKVKDNNVLDQFGVPINTSNEGRAFYFPIAVFQYGLGAYDLFLETGDESYKGKFMNIVNWALENQQMNGAWDAFGWCDEQHPFSSMAQSEGASLLCRAFIETKDENYLKYAKKALDFMLVSVEDGGTAYYDDLGNLVSLEESGKIKTVMNGMIFSVWGIFDYLLCASDDNLERRLTQAVESLSGLLPQFDRGYWSNYDLENHIASPFYHTLHIEQLKVMEELFPDKNFKDYRQKFEKYSNSKLKSKRAFVVKAIQKMRSIKSDSVIVE